MEGKIQFLCEEIVVISEASPAVALEDSEDLRRTFNDLSGEIKY